MATQTGKSDMPREAEVTLDDGTVEWVFIEFDKDEGWVAYGDGFGVLSDLNDGSDTGFQGSSVDAIHTLARENGFEATDISFQD